MKKLLFIPIFILTLIFIGCEDGLTDIKFDLPYETTFVVDETATPGESTEFKSPEIETSTAKEFEKNGVSIETLKSASLKSLTLLIESPENANFNNIQRASVYLSSDLQPSTLIAEVSNVPPDVNTLEVGVKDANLIEFLKGDFFQVIVKAVTKEGVTEEMTVRAKMVLDVVANPLKQ